MSTPQMQQGGLLDVLKKKMRQTKEEMEKYKEDCEELQKKLHLEVMRREEVRVNKILCLMHSLLVLCCRLERIRPFSRNRSFTVCWVYKFFIDF